MDDLISRLRALSRHEHSDMTIGDEAADALEAAREDVRRLEPWWVAVFDNAAVFAALNRNAKPRTSPENVADVLDAVANVARAAIDAAREARNG